MRLTGRVVDYETSDGVPSATVELWTDNVMLQRTIANKNGDFDIGTGSTPDVVRLSSAGYQAVDYPYDQVSDDSLFPIEKFIKEEEEVTITSHRTKNGMWIFAALGLLLLLNKRR